MPDAEDDEGDEHERPVGAEDVDEDFEDWLAVVLARVDGGAEVLD